jgi:dTDP-4-dehydrorhamnose reductase
MNILLLGKNGQVGRELQRTLLPLGSLLALDKYEQNLVDLEHLDTLLNRYAPDIIVNAAAYTAVDKAETDCETTYRINHDAITILADYAARTQALLVHYSTDYVFDGQKSTAYLEHDKTNPQSVYGASKRAGEIAILQKNCHFLLFRTSWVFSVHGRNFIKTILQLAKEKDSLHIVADQYGAPTSAELIADITALAIASYRKGCIDDGIYHLTASGTTNWYQLACYAIGKVHARGKKLSIDEKKIYPIATKDYPLPAKRPVNSALDTTAIRNALGIYLPIWTVYVDRMIDQLIDLEFFV